MGKGGGRGDGVFCGVMCCGDDISGVRERRVSVSVGKGEMEGLCGVLCLVWFGLGFAIGLALGFGAGCRFSAFGI